MLIPKEWRIPFAFLAIALFVGVGIAGMLSFSAPYDDPCAQYAKASEYERHKGCVDSAATQSIAEYTQWLAYFTVILAIGTLGLGAIGFWQGRLARAEFIASHRPLLVVRSINLNWDDKSPERTTIWFTLINEGIGDAEEIDCEFQFMELWKGSRNKSALLSTEGDFVFPRALRSGESAFCRCQVPYNLAAFLGEASWADTLVDYGVKKEPPEKQVAFAGVTTYIDKGGRTRETGYFRLFDMENYRFVSSNDPDREYPG